MLFVPDNNGVLHEATRRLVVRLAETLSRAMAWQTSLLEPRSILSRGVCGLTREQVQGIVVEDYTPLS